MKTCADLERIVVDVANLEMSEGLTQARPPSRPGKRSRLTADAHGASLARRTRRPAGTARRAARRRRPGTAFVLSGGASLGALQVGMVAALYEHGITADLLVGTSVGALNAAFLASRPQTPATVQELTRVWRSIHRQDAFPLSLRTVVGGLAGQRDHLVPARGLRQIVQRHVEFTDLSDAAVPLHLVAFDLSAGAETVLFEGPAIEAIVASCSIPGIFPPVAIGERLLVDGGVVNNTPIRHAVELGAERIYVLPTQGPSYTQISAPRTALDAAIYGLGLLISSRLESDIARYGDDVELIVLPAPNSRQVQPTDFDQSSRLTAEAHAAALEALVHGTTPPQARALGAA
jgi:NTE family protein